MAVAEKQSERHDVGPALNPLPTGPAAAATLSAGLGVLVLGLMTTGAEISAGLKSFLTWYVPVGPLSGKTGVAVIAWLVSWWLLGRNWGDSEVDFGKMWRYSLIAMILGALLMFPPVFEAFAH